MAATQVRMHSDMTEIRAFITSTVRNVKNPITARFKNKAFRLVKASIREEFQSSTWNGPGGRKQWKELLLRKGKPFHGTRGSLYKAWSDATVTSSDRDMTITATHAGMAMHRGGSGESISENRTTKVLLKPSSRYAIFRKTGVWITARHVTIPARPHATMNQKLVDSIRDAMMLEVFR